MTSRPDIKMDDRELFINRELSWLEFNARVLEEAQDKRRPLLERLKFLAIFSSNLDEFFMIRVGGLRQRDPNDVASSESGDGLTTAQVLGAVSTRVHELVALQNKVFREEVLPGLAEAGLKIIRAKDIKGAEDKALDARFVRDMQPVLTPMAIDPAHPFPHIQNRQLYIAALLKAKAQGRLRAPKTFLGIVPLPALLPRFIPLSAGEGKDHFVLLEDLIGENLEKIFSGFEATERACFRLTRDQDFELSDQDSDDLLRQIQTGLAKRKQGIEVRLEISAGATDKMRESLLKWFDVEAPDIYEVDGPLNLAGFWALHGLPGYAPLRDPLYVPQIGAALRRAKGDLFTMARSGDILLHHPYEAFDTVVDFLDQAAADPQVLAIKQTLYRAGRNSPVVAALARAAERDKQVTVLIELKARFDEEANIEWARTLEKAGAHVVYGVPGLKTHAKCVLVVRRDTDRIRRYVHLSTGNYNPWTARTYTDVGLITTDDRLGEDASALFDMLTAYVQPARWNRMRVAPHGLREWVIEMVEREVEHHKAGRPARIAAKINGLVDRDVIRALYKASKAGVPIDLVVRGICCLRPGLPGVSETIQVRSIVGRYLEHSRIAYFANGGAPEVYMTSADWMPRNFDRRVEIAYPVESEPVKRRVIDEILGAALRDDANARVLGPDGRYARVGGAFDSHAVLEELAGGAPRGFSLPAAPVEVPKTQTA
jgi:polyphosphate kinase